MNIPSIHHRLTAVFAVILLVTGIGAAGAAAKADQTTKITVFAAASLTDVMPAIDRDQTYSFAGSNALATQIRNGAPADLFLSANTEIPALLHQQGFVDQPVNFVRNTLVVVVPKSNPAGLKTIYDLSKPGVKLVVAASSVPVGAYTLQILRQMNLSSKVLPNIVSQETDVRSVLSKIALGQGDAGFVYLSDAQTVPNDVTVINLPGWAQPKVMYAMAVVSKSANKAAAQAFMTKLLSRSGQDTFAKYGFLRLSTSGTADVGRLKVVKLTQRVKRGSKASLTVASPTKTACRIAVLDAKGKSVKASGLVKKQPTAAGTILWRWAVPKATVVGRSSIQVTCGTATPLKTGFTVLR